jgi:DNA repair exonuclease SbcCD nuclease subunit
MKFAIITDTHFGARNDSIVFNDYFYKFWEKTFFQYLKENNIDTVVHLGDVMDRRKFVSYKIAQDFRERFLQVFEDNNIHLKMIVGNHDIYYRNTNNVNSLNELVGRHPYGRYNNIYIYDECRTLDFDGVPILLIPWINSENYESTIAEINNTKAQIAMGHLEINGFEMHSGHFAQGGYDKGLFKKFDMVFSGHFHKKSDDGQIFYLGSTYQITWADYDCPRGFHIFDTETRELNRVLNPHTIFKKIYYDDVSYNYDDFDFNSVSQQYTKVIVVHKKDLYKFDLFIDKLLKSGAHDVKIVEDFSDLDASNVSDNVIEQSEDTLSLLNNYIDQLEINLDKSRLSDIMKSLYLQASELEV